MTSLRALFGIVSFSFLCVLIVTQTKLSFRTLHKTLGRFYGRVIFLIFYHSILNIRIDRKVFVHNIHL